ncbi:MAG: CDP-alcohol phosphatidyltransferase family protein [Ruminococcus sp.]|nr:CDP-alcohol phosphatidyltransferase family protein [Candidatus Copronaster equi]
MIANSITVSRILFSFLLLVFPPSSFLFAVFYVLCGASDVLDGFFARKLHTESEKGAILDSAADLVFALIYAVRILPLMEIPLWIWVWIALIAVIKTAGIIYKSCKNHKLFIEHSFMNKLTGILLFLLPLSVYFTDVKYGAIIVCTVASLATVTEIIIDRNKQK